MSQTAAGPAAHLQLQGMRSDYNQASRDQSRSLQLFKPFLNAAVSAHSASAATGSGAFVIADFGCSTGLNSSDAVSHMIAELRNKYTGERCSSVLVVLNDLPRNHWGEVFHFLHGDSRSFLNEHPGVFAVASGLTFYEQVLPDRSLQFGMSNICLHWCSQLPVKMSGHCFSMLATDEEQEAFRQQAAKDWSSFLTARTNELVSGGVLALNVVTTQESTIGIHEAIGNAAKSLLSRGVISSDEFLNFNVPMCFRTLAEVSDKAQYEALGLELLMAEKFPLTRSAYYEDFLHHGDVSKFALEYSKSCQVTCEPTFLDALSGRSEDAKRKICEDLWREHQAIIAAQPARFGFIWATIGLVIRKK